MPTLKGDHKQKGMSLKKDPNRFQRWLADMEFRISLRKFQIKSIALVVVFAIGGFFAFIGMMLWFILKVIFVHGPKLIYSGLFFLLYGAFVRVWLFLVRPRKIPWDMIAVAAIVLGLSIWWSVASDNWTNFQRSGSLLVVLALAAYGLDYRRRIKNTVDQVIVSLDDNLADLASISEGKNLKRIWHYQWIVRELEILKREWKAVDIEDEVKSAQRWELWMLMLGTLIWGYGDLLGQFF